LKIITKLSKDLPLQPEIDLPLQPEIDLPLQPEIEMSCTNARKKPVFKELLELA
jgi:hypothetical protein